MEACEGGEIECSRCHEHYEAEDMGRTHPWQGICHSCDALRRARSRRRYWWFGSEYY